MSDSTYIYDQAWVHEGDRLVALEEMYDRGTMRLLSERGLAPGWQCLEVGAGAGGIARWLAEQVDPDGHVVATDLDTRFLETIHLPNLIIRRHNVQTDDLDSSSFDLIHVRAVLMHLPDPQGAIDRMVRALKPGGWLVAEEPDFREPMGAAMAAYVRPVEAVAPRAKFALASTHLRSEGGPDPDLAPRLPDLLASSGLEDVDAEVRSCLVRAGTVRARFVELNIEYFGDRLVAAGLLSEEDLAKVRQAVFAAGGRWLSPAVVAVWGRTPRAQRSI
jgi:SAM-dependent methyltransferase